MPAHFPHIVTRPPLMTAAAEGRFIDFKLLKKFKRSKSEPPRYTPRNEMYFREQT